ncbi:ABC transporter substrate-binding protein [Pseudomonas cremoricolorata]|uniref:ABC transporter substrate-binding protein n=1 Tax=Pseudomonas cremoricolorata TaxID=157783 RepID=UPI0003F775F8|nr:ABC transporter substrate-binding protein [Pseudomonas cremoricolorata]
MNLFPAWRRLLPLFAIVCCWLGLALPASAVQVTDVLGRTVSLDKAPQRIVLGEGRLFFALALLDRDNPFQRVVGWQNDMRLLDPHTYEVYAKQYPQIAKLPLIGQASEQSVSAEQILSLKPDLAIFSISGEGPTQHSPVADLLAKAGVPVLFIDFRVHPIRNTRVSLEALGSLLERKPQADEFLSLYDRHLKQITDRVAGIKDSERPKVFLELLPGVWQAPGHTTGKSGLGSVVTAVGGHNIAADVVPGALGDVSVEYVLERDPDVYIATGNRAPGVLLGAGVSEQTARDSLARITARPEFAPLRPIQQGQAHALWHDFYNSPFNILAIEAMAGWIHPELFKDIDPKATQAQINQLLNVDLDGQYWIDAK